MDELMKRLIQVKLTITMLRYLSDDVCMGDVYT